MVTQCPSCSTVYEVSATDLSVGRGKVRCGFCETMFDALVALSEDAPLHGTTLTGLPAPERLTRQSERDGEPGIVDDHERMQDSELSAPSTDAAVEHGVLEPAASAAGADNSATTDAPAADGSESHGSESSTAAPAGAETQQESDEPGADARAAPVAASTNQSQPSIASPVIGSASVTSEAPGLSDAPAAFAMPDAPGAADATAPSDARDAADRADADSARTTAESTAALDLELLPSPRHSTPARIAWGTAATLMALALLVQIVHRSRDQLLAQSATAPYLQRIYDALGIDLDPHWDVGRYKVIRRPNLSSERSADGEHAQLRLAATIMNGAMRPQPYPLIRLTLEDRWGSAVAGRDFAPREYLRDAARATDMLAPGEHVPIDLVVIDPGADTVGFTIDVCLTDASGIVRCAGDATGS
jgi:predicted Zn finger-like uncharacterized protein